jgi:mRNA-degrading endonuclease RelE of RelBE toxin-antitoxin system
MKIKKGRQFKKDLNNLPKEIYKKAKEDKLPLFLHNPRHPSLKIKKMRKCNCFEGHIDDKYVFTFNIEQGIYKFYRIGSHEIYKNPMKEILDGGFVRSIWLSELIEKRRGYVTND